MEPSRVRPLSERDIDSVIASAGGTRAHENAHQRDKVGADYLLGSAVIELKAFDDEGFSKPERQRKLAELFDGYFLGRPVVVLDPSVLSPEDRQSFDRIIEGPIQTAVRKARKQLKQSRAEHPDTTCSVLFVVNTGYTTLTHDDLCSLVAHRARNDTSEIDAVVVAGAYYHSDGFDSFFLWPIDCVEINADRPFVEFEALRKSWGELSNRFMTDLMRGQLDGSLDRGPVADTQFDIDGVTYVRPAPAMGKESVFYINGRPRHDSLGLESCPPVGMTFPRLSSTAWARINNLLPSSDKLSISYEAWQAKEARAHQSDTELHPLVTVEVTAEEWEHWCEGARRSLTARSVSDFATSRFDMDVRSRLSGAFEWGAPQQRPVCYVLVVTEVIGQDQANDVSHIGLAEDQPTGETWMLSFVQNARIRHEHALALGAAYAVRQGVSTVLWLKDLTYAWI